LGASYADLLCSPFVGLSLPSLAVCLAVVNDSPEGSPARLSFSEETCAQIPEAEQPRFLRGRGLFERLRDKAPEAPVSALVSELWHAEGYRYETEWNSQIAAYREFCDYLFHLAAKADEEGRDLAAFADSIQKLRDNGGSLAATGVGGAGAAVPQQPRGPGGFSQGSGALLRNH
jgi:ATP-dependent helicase/nuclease subunit A